jgi:hypothetical protein
VLLFTWEDTISKKDSFRISHHRVVATLRREKGAHNGRGAGLTISIETIIRHGVIEAKAGMYAVDLFESAHHRVCVSKPGESQPTT